MNVHRCMIVPILQVSTAQIICEQLAGPPGSGMFKRNVYTAGVHTHYISNGGIQQYFADLMPLNIVELIETSPEQFEWQITSTLPGDAQTTYDLLQQLPIPPSITLADIQTLFSVVDVSIQQPEQALNRLGMTL